MKKRIPNRPMIILGIVNLFFTILLLSFVFSLNVLPLKYFIFILLGLLIIDGFTLFLVKKKNKALKFTGYFISSVLILVSIVGIYYISKTNKFLNEAFNNASNSYTNTYYVITLNTDDYKETSDLEEKKLAYYEILPNVNEALKELSKIIKTNNENYKDLYTMFSDLDNEKVNAILIEKSFYSFLMEDNDQVNLKEYKVLYSFDLTFEEQTEEIVDDGSSFNVYIGGADFTEMYNDFNMIVTINKKTHKILLTSTPRDFYVTIADKGMKDLLGYANVWGINTSRKTLENLYGVNIDYFVKINTKSLVGLVDTLGGIEFCSDIDFVTTHATVIGTYDDTIGKKLNVSKGCKKYTGIQILTIARERKAYPDGDRQRQKNCQQIMINIFNKMLKPENITNYSNILSSVSNLYTTNIPKELVTEIAKDTIDNGAKWTFEQQSVTGRDSSGYVHLGSVKDYVMVPNMESVTTATEKIKKIQSGK